MLPISPGQKCISPLPSPEEKAEKANTGVSHWQSHLLCEQPGISNPSQYMTKKLRFFKILFRLFLRKLNVLWCGEHFYNSLVAIIKKTWNK
jgi:hypothetical protein